MEDQPATQTYLKGLDEMARAVNRLARDINRLKEELIEELDDLKARVTALE